MLSFWSMTIGHGNMMIAMLTFSTISLESWQQMKTISHLSNLKFSLSQQSHFHSLTSHPYSHSHFDRANFILGNLFFLQCALYYLGALFSFLGALYYPRCTMLSYFHFQVHYATALDWFIICSFLYCMASILEFAGVHYFTKVCLHIHVHIFVSVCLCVYLLSLVCLA